MSREPSPRKSKVSFIMKYTLYVKVSPTGLRYLGKYTQRQGRTVYNYLGSGKRWRNHLNLHGFKAKDLQTIILLETSNKEELIEKGLYYSELYNVVESVEWANLKVEGGDGGSTTRGRVWTTNGVVDDYTYPDKIQKGYILGRSLNKGKKFPERSIVLQGKHVGRERPQGSGKPPIPVQQMEKTTGEILNTYSSQSEAAKILGICGSDISACCKGKQKSAGGFVWKYLNKP